MTQQKYFIAILCGNDSTWHCEAGDHILLVHKRNKVAENIVFFFLSKMVKALQSPKFSKSWMSILIIDCIKTYHSYILCKRLCVCVCCASGHQLCKKSCTLNHKQWILQGQTVSHFDLLNFLFNVLIYCFNILIQHFNLLKLIVSISWSIARLQQEARGRNR